VKGMFKKLWKGVVKFFTSKKKFFRTVIDCEIDKLDEWQDELVLIIEQNVKPEELAKTIIEAVKSKLRAAVDLIL